MKKNKKFYIIVLLVITMLTTGCGSNSYIKDEKGKSVTNSETGQSLQQIPTGGLKIPLDVCRFYRSQSVKYPAAAPVHKTAGTKRLSCTAFPKSPAPAGVSYPD